MKAYPSISTKIDFSQKYHIFDKLDGSNIRAEWSPKQGFYKFGSRTQLLVPDQRTLYPSIDAFNSLHGEELNTRLSKLKAERAVVYFEWVSPESFAGNHPQDLSTMRPVLIDIDVYKKGLMPPERFLDFTAGLLAAKLLHYGKIDEEFFQSVRNRTLDGMTYEGVVGKQKLIDKGSCEPFMFKIKSNDWLNRLKEFCNNDEQMFNRLK
jgi:hypothetical protein